MFQFSRRAFLKMTLVSAVASQLGACGGDDDTVGNNSSHSVVGTAFFPQSVASGDPKPSSVILWTRVQDSDLQITQRDALLHLQVAKDTAFKNIVVEQADLNAEAAHNHCIKVKLTNLQPYTTYYYRFLYSKNNVRYHSNTGRTKTAPAPNENIAVRFAVLNCQDYVGRYYNSLAWLLAQTEEPDFVVYVGDYIYETSGDPSFQRTGSTRTVNFSKPEEAIALGSGETTFFAAASLSNYRDLYHIYRGDAMLQKVHERFPMVAIWDDHEYSDDCYGATATYHNEIKAENTPERRQNAEQVFFEYMPIDDEDVGLTQAFTTPINKLFPYTRLYRDLQFGQNLHLLLTDYRSFRPDHLIPEDGFPGSVVMDKEALITVFNLQSPGNGAAIYAAQKALFGPYVDMQSAPWEAYQAAFVPILTQSFMNDGLTQQTATAKATQIVMGKLSAFVFNQLVSQYNQAVAGGLIAGSQIAAIDDATYASLDTGIAYLHLGKQASFTEFGARYGVVKSTFDLYAAYRYVQQRQIGQRAEDVFGATQENWLWQKIQTSPAKFVALASSVSTATLGWDFSNNTAIPEAFRTAFYLNVDHWDGFPNKRKELLAQLRQRGNAFLFAGDIHSAYVVDHDGVADFTSPAISSGTFFEFGQDAVKALGSAFTVEQQASLQALLTTDFEQLMQSFSPNLKFADTRQHGFIMLQVDATQVQATFHLLPSELVNAAYYEQIDTLKAQVTQKRFILQNGIVNMV
ncbi:alkaline phosphatase D family protein [Thioflexithrix psekupsensis]|uniref:Metallophosphatase n=1 Tax=Thioflexithrix psekupsensis TaxID=1570016 RepID=A0A251X6L8_9GAMM|nr:alkaline phosphatase D family protein [Thioflexithrix psekupsensis]OUD13262.1 hypothetical protein TPSD3_11565 [Thioflexithrix psekupsensis]